jgi:hypothetical protein
MPVHRDPPGEPPEERPKYNLPSGFKKSAEVFNLNRALQEELGVDLPVHRAIHEDISSGVKEGLGELDLFALEKHYTR